MAYISEGNGVYYVHFFFEQNETDNPLIKRTIDANDFQSQNEYIECEIGIINGEIVSKVAVINDGEGFSEEIYWTEDADFDEALCDLAIASYHDDYYDNPKYPFLSKHNC